ncbi:hypothetical protein H4R33_001716 [Dimargaris cristalligena]|nr:hypothetical protein H4R33_001716 [Dimargaris cristalligena]
MLSVIGCLALLSYLVVLAISLAHGQTDSNVKGIDLIPNSYIVQFPGDPGTSGGNKGAGTFHKQMQALNVPYTITSNYSTLFNAAALQMDDQYLDSVVSLANNKGTWPQRVIAVNSQTDYSSKYFTLPPKKQLAHAYTGVERVHSELGLSGKNIKIGFLDSGLDYTHPAFGGCFGPGCRVQFGFDFVGDNYTGYNVPQPDDDPMDPCNVHGTHVAGIATGNHGEFQGVAPHAVIGAYRVMGCSLKTDTTVLLAGLEKAYLDGMDIINLSVGAGSGWANSFEAVAVENAFQLGRYIVTGAGNNGFDSLWSITKPSASPHSIAVGAVDLPQHYALYLNVTTDRTETYERSDQQRYLAPLNLVNVPIIQAKSNTGDDYACTSLTGVSGAIVVAQKGGSCSLMDMVKNVFNAGGVAMVVYNNREGDLGPLLYTENIALPSFSLLRSAGLKLVAQLAKGGSPKGTVKNDALVFDSGFAQPRVSVFSAWGPSPDGNLKPDIVAPGSGIYSTIPQSMGSYGVGDGTSMAAPYISGSVALLLEANRVSTNWDVYCLLLNTATPLWNRPKVLQSAAMQGSGFLQLYNALTTDFSFSATYKHESRYSADNNKLVSRSLTVRNLGSSGVTYNFEYLPALSVSGFDKQKVAVYPPRTSQVAGDAYFIFDSIKLAAKKTAKNSITIDLSAIRASDFMVHSGYVNAYPADGKGYNLTYPIVGFAYPSSTIPLLSPQYGGLKLPCTMRKSNGKCLTGTNTYTFVGDDVPVIRFHLQHPVRRLRIRVAFSQTPTKPHAVVTENHFMWMSKNLSDDDQLYYEYVWRGRAYYSSSPNKIIDLPNKDYVLTLEFYATCPEDPPIRYVSSVIRVARK